jgi:hypothetical protein
MDFTMDDQRINLLGIKLNNFITTSQLCFVIIQKNQKDYQKKSHADSAD